MPKRGGDLCIYKYAYIYMIFIYLQSFFITLMVYLDPICGPNLWTQSVNFFSGVISTTSSVMFIAARISYVRFFTAVHIYDFHISTITIHHLY